MKKIPMILLAMFTLSGCDRQEMIYSFNHVEEASVDNEAENTESVDNIQANTEQAMDITTEDPEISDVYSGPTVTLTMVGDVLLHTPVEESCQAEDGSYDFSSPFCQCERRGAGGGHCDCQSGSYHWRRGAWGIWLSKF